VATHAVRHTDYSLETHSFCSHHLGDTLLSLFVIYSRHTTSSLHGDTRRLIRHTDPSRHTGNCCSFFPIRHTDPSRHTGHFLLMLLGDTLDKPSATHSRNSLVYCHRQHMPEFFLVVVGLFIDEVFVFLFLLGDPVHSHGSFLSLSLQCPGHTQRASSLPWQSGTLSRMFFFLLGDPVHSHEPSCSNRLR